MRILILLTIFISNISFAKDPLSTTVNAYQKTKEGRKVSKNLEQMGKRIIKDLEIPTEALAIGKIAVDQRINFNINKNNRIDINYREKSFMYQINYDF